ncbi:MAG: beta-ketoacyl-ACP synthase II [bacterium]
MKNRVVATGLGMITPIGTGKEKFWDNLLAGKSGVRRITRFDPSGLATQIAGEVPDFEPFDYLDKKEAKRMDRFTQFAVAGTSLALADAGLDLEHIDRERAGVVFSSGIGGLETLENQMRVMFEKGVGKVSPFFIPMMITNMAAGHISIVYGLKGINSTLVAACASSTHAIGEAFRALQRGDADVVVTGGSEAAVVTAGVAGFCSLKALSTRNEAPEKASRPFDRDRDGFVMGEGAGVVILETLEHAKKRGAHIYGEVIGYGNTADAYHITQPPPEGDGSYRSMQTALADAGVRPEDVGYINAHGTSTEYNDKFETMAIKRLFGEHAYQIPISSTKSMTGHLLGAAGCVEFIASVLTLERGVIHPTINYENPDPNCDLDYVPNTARNAAVQIAISNSFGFGGQNGTLVMKKYME